MEDLIKICFDKNQPVAIIDIYNHLRSEYGYVPSNLTAFLMGFLLKEYSSPKYRYIDKNGAGAEMTPDKLAELISNCINEKDTESCIKQMGVDEQAFYSITEMAWGIPHNTLSDPTKAATAVKNRMQAFGLPVWCLKTVDSDGVYYLVSKYIDLVQKEGASEYQIAVEIGSESRKNENMALFLKNLLMPENCRRGMLKYVDGFESGRLRNLADKIGATNDQLLQDISRFFSVEHSNLWNLDTGEDQLRNLATDYTYVKATNDILHISAHSRNEADKEWQGKLKFVMCSCEALMETYPGMKTAFEFLKKIDLDSEILPEQMKAYTEALVDSSSALEGYISNEIPAFAKIYAPYLEGLNDEDMAQLRTTELAGIFKKTRTESNAIVKRVADEFRKNQTKTQLQKFWRDKTGTKTPLAWSRNNRTPILKVVPNAEYDLAKKTFDILNRGVASESELREALDFLNRTILFEALNDQERIDNAFKSILGIYGTILTDLNAVRDSLEGLPVEPYDWDTHPSVSLKIEELAKVNYDAGGSDKAVAIINSMSVEELKKHLITRAKESMSFGIEIINGGE